MRIAVGVLLLAAGLYALACLGLYLAQRSLLYFPQPRRFGTPDTLLTVPVGAERLNVTVRPLAGPQAVLYFGGNAEDVSGSLPQLAGAFPGHALYLPHYRGYGGSTGKPTEAALFADALALFDHVRAQHANVTVIGRSLGSGMAVHVASTRPAARLVLITPYDSIAGIAAGQFPWFPVQRLLTDKFESWRYAPKVEAFTTLIVAEHDELIPRASSELLLTRFKAQRARLVVIPGTGHNTVSDHPMYAQALTGDIHF